MTQDEMIQTTCAKRKRLAYNSLSPGVANRVLGQTEREMVNALPRSRIVTRESIMQKLLNLLHEKREVGTGEGKIGRRDAVMFNMGMNMLVMRMGTGQRGVMWMLLRIIPI